jgi:biopolymer transport protein ExbD
MAMQNSSEENEIGNINITPMVDVILVLLVIFMVTANFLKRESVNINLPKAAAADPNEAQSVQVAMMKDGKILLEGAPATETRLESALSREAKLRPNMRVTLSADERLAYGEIAGVMGLIRKSGVSRIALSVKR